MKKVSTLFLVALFCLGIAGTCEAETSCNFRDIIFDNVTINNEHNKEFRTIRIYVSLSIEMSVHKITKITVRRYIFSKDKRIADVTNYSMVDLFKVSLKIHGIKDESYSIKKITRIVTGTGTYYMFDYVSEF